MLQSYPGNNTFLLSFFEQIYKIYIISINITTKTYIKYHMKLFIFHKFILLNFSY
jgi:hypothetical protein